MFKSKNLAILAVLNLAFSSLSFASFFGPPVVGGTEVTDPKLLSAVITVQGVDGCSGFMISSQYAITAHHCGVVNDAQPSATVQGIECSVIAATDAPNGDAHFGSGDFTLMKLKCPGLDPQSIVPFELPEQDEAVVGDVNLAGFGMTSLGSSDNTTLYSTNASVTTDYDYIQKQSAQEIKSFPEIGTALSSAQNGLNLCYLETIGHTVYYGDSGGPVYVATATGFKVVGLNSMIMSNSNFLVPDDIYAMCGPKLSHYSDWIKAQIKN